LWLSAFSKAWHFRYETGAWFERDTNQPLEKVLSELFTKRLGKPIQLTNPGPAE
jgi:frataxin-like iron-binding protein CyaY